MTEHDDHRWQIDVGDVDPDDYEDREFERAEYDDLIRREPVDPRLRIVVWAPPSRTGAGPE